MAAGAGAAFFTAVFLTGATRFAAFAEWLACYIFRSNWGTMEPIFDKNGQVVAWLRETDIYDLRGNHAAVINGTNAYDQQGRHLGAFAKGFFRDRAGDAVAFTKGATGGPLPPVPSIPPIPPVPSIPPIPAVPAIPPIPAIPTFKWSNADWERFIVAH